MTCEECEEILLDSDKCASRKNWMPGISILKIAQLHAENCSGCASRMSEIARMNDGLELLRVSTKRMEAPTTIEDKLLAEFQRRRAQPVALIASTFRWRLVWGSALALLLVASMALYSRLRARSSTAAGAYKTESPIQQPSPSGSGASSDQTSNRNDQVEAHRPNLASSKREARKKLERHAHEHVWGGPSLLLKDELSLNGGGNIVRVTLPVASLVAMGVPMYPEVSNGSVTADVTRDPFGAVIAIRLVETRPSTN